jgi:hypothetical protein
MMCRLFLFLSYVLIFNSILSATELTTPKYPTQPSPQLGLAKIDSESVLIITTISCREVEETVTQQVPYTVTRKINGQEVHETRVRTVVQKISRPVYETFSENFEEGNYWVSRDGKRLDSKTSTEILSKNTPVVIVKTARLPKSLDPFYQEFFKAGTLIVGAGKEPDVTALSGPPTPVMNGNMNNGPSTLPSFGQPVPKSK